MRPEVIQRVSLSRRSMRVLQFDVVASGHPSEHAALLGSLSWGARVPDLSIAVQPVSRSRFVVAELTRSQRAWIDAHRNAEKLFWVIKLLLTVNAFLWALSGRLSAS